MILSTIDGIQFKNEIDRYKTYFTLKCIYKLTNRTIYGDFKINCFFHKCKFLKYRCLIYLIEKLNSSNYLNTVLIDFNTCIISNKISYLILYRVTTELWRRL